MILKLSLKITPLLIASQLAWGNPNDIHVGVMDSPVNVGHPLIRPYLAEEAMRSSMITLQEGQQISLWDYNQKCYDSISSQINEDSKTNKAYRTLQDLTAIGAELPNGERDKSVDSKSRTIGSFIGDLFKVLFGTSVSPDPKFRIAALNLGLGMHGTHVTGIITGNIEKNKEEANIKIMIFPAYCNIAQKILRKDLKAFYAHYKDEEQSQDFQNPIESFSQIIKEKNVRAINLSLGASVETIKKSTKGQSSFGARYFSGGKIRKISKAIVEKQLEEMKNLVNENPDTLFIFSAGNEGKNLKKFTSSFSELKNDHVIFVAAEDEKNNKLAKFSNYHSELVEISASGTKILSANAISKEGGLTSASGTSMAAPMVTYAAWSLLNQDPTITGPELKKQILSSKTKVNPERKNKIKDGKVLSLNP